MSETTPTPEPANSGVPSDPTAPGPPTWTPPDPLAAPQPWAPPAPWAPAQWTPAPWAPPGSAAPDGPAASPPPGPSAPDATGTTPGTPPAPTGWAAPEPVPGPPGWAGPRFPPPVDPNHPGTVPAPPWPGGPPGPGWPPAGYPPPYAYPGSAPPRRSAGGRAAAVVVTVVIALVLAVCGCVGLGVLGSFVDDSTTSGQPSDPEFDEPDGGLAGEPTDDAPPAPVATPSGGPGRFSVVYEVTGTGAVDVQFYDANADFFQIDGVPAPWRMALTANDRERVQVIATPTGSGTASCRIIIDGKVVSRDSGEYGATCFGW
ncbi:MmpS family transport accessory protein [Micromonospora sp. NPDC004551]|uniref:MmpS family transport accessory protein n=1 Tax=Micromonospora sp. NPDC004551 TaxID=3154284 RepID=UPI0033B8C774